MSTEYFLYSIRNLSYRKLRSWLTILGIFIGMSAIVSLIALGTGLENAIDELLGDVGANRLIVTPGSGTANYGPVGSGLTPDKLKDGDLDVIKKVNGVDSVLGLYSKTARIKFGGKIKSASVFGAPTTADSRNYIEEISLFTIESGRELKVGATYELVIGHNLAKNLFDKELEIGDKVGIEGKQFKIVGIQKKSGSPMHDGMARTSIDILREIYNVEDDLSSIFVEVDKSFVVSEIVEDIKRDMRNYRNVEEGEEDFDVQSSESMLAGVGNILAIVQGVLIGLAAISLLVGGVGIMNTMYTSVTERTKEIGIMKSVGATQTDIATIFFIEAGLLGTMGGIIGIIFGSVIAKLVEYGAEISGFSLLKAAITPELILGTLIFSFLVGSISGLLPTLEAIKLQPVTALRSR